MTELNRARVEEAAAYGARWFAYQRDLKDLVGVVAGIRYGNDTVLLTASGHASLEHATPLTPEHRFRIASHSKTLTAIGIMLLVEAGSVRLDDPLSRYIPWLGGALAAATVRQTLNHTTGMIRDGLDSDYWQLDRPFPDAAELRALVEDGGAVLPANERFKYSNIGYSLLGLVIERAGGLPYHDYMRTRIVEPLGLMDTGPDTDTTARASLVTGYYPRRPGFPRRPVADVSTGAMAPATGFYSTASDLLRVATALVLGNEELLSDAAKREMQAPTWTVGGDNEKYGLGLAVVDIGERRLVGHGGSFPGHTTRTWVDPRHGLAVTVLINGTGAPAKLFAGTLVKLIDCAVTRGEPSPEQRKRLDTFTGRFWSAWGPGDIVRFGDALLLLTPEADDPTDGPIELEVLNGDTLRMTEEDGYGSPGETIRYEREADGTIARVRIGGDSAYPEDRFRAWLAARGETDPETPEFAVPVTVR